MAAIDLQALASGTKDAIKATWIRSVGADSLPGVQFTEPAGDPGLFGPGSSIWYVHSDVATLVGGLSGLLLGALHQPTMHGTNQHSSYTDDPLARLGRTASFVNAMTWAAMPVVEKTCDTVRKMHKRVVGTMPDGRPYSANAAEQLVWTAVTQSHSIMRAHLRYHPKPLSGARIDEYYAQYAQFAIQLGADIPVPSSRTEVDDYFNEMRPLLTFAEETAELVDYFRKPIGPDPVAKASSVIIMRAALDTMPSWAQRLYGIRGASKVSALPKRIDTIATRNAAKVVLGILRWGIEEPVIQIEARNRAEASVGVAASA
ncbi:MAG TPA: oxygenase MpaB family protein [Mycobacteriales bacterium]|nr:oxygenase MpaB family protein [Mycobacteriales bacterium]